MHIFAVPSREFSSAGSEHLPYKQRVGGSNPSTPTTAKDDWFSNRLFSFVRVRKQASAALPNKKGRNTVPPIRPAAVGEVYMGLRGGGCLRLRLTSRGRRAMAPPFESLNSHYGGRRLVFQSSFFVCPRRPKNISRQPQLFCSKYRIFQEYISLTCANEKRRVAPP